MADRATAKAHDWGVCFYLDPVLVVVPCSYQGRVPRCVLLVCLANKTRRRHQIQREPCIFGESFLKDRLGVVQNFLPNQGCPRNVPRQALGAVVNKVLFLGGGLPGKTRSWPQKEGGQWKVHGPELAKPPGVRPIRTETIARRNKKASKDLGIPRVFGRADLCTQCQNLHTPLQF